VESIIDKLKVYALTDFEVEVLLAVSKIPKGKAVSYKEIAERVHRPNAYRAVGNALRKNPFPVKIPCHRVIMSNGSLGKYSYGGKGKKRSLLLSEGYEFK
jgi:methylated-DNA-[protein]-cysteine S-methyltransferase